MKTYHQIVHRLTEHHTTATGIILLAILLGTSLTFPQVWRFTRNLITVAHESSHAIMAKLWLRKLAGIHLHSDTSGATYSGGGVWGISNLFTTMAGYPGPALMGAGILELIHLRLVFLSLIAVGLVVLFVFLLIRNPFGLLVEILLGCSLYLIYHYASIDVVSLILSTLGFFLILGGGKTILELHHQLQKGNASEGNDATAMRKLTHLHEQMWIGLWLALTVCCLLFSLLNLL